MSLPGGRYPTRIASVSILPPVALDRRLDFGNRALDLILGIDAPQTVGAQDDQIAVAQRRAAGEINDGIDQAAQAAEDLVAVGVVDDLVRADDPLVDEVLHFRVILGLSDQSALAKEIQPRIADVRPVRVI